jgi:hypothetical protein
LIGKSEEARRSKIKLPREFKRWGFMKGEEAL